MWWKKNEKKSSGRKQRSLSWSTFNGSSTQASGSLDQSKHRGSSIQSLMSLEQFLMTCEDERNIRSIPLIHQERNADIPFEVKVEEEDIKIDAFADDDLWDVTADTGFDGRQSVEKSLPVALIDDSFAPLAREEELHQEKNLLSDVPIKSKKDISNSTPATQSLTLCETNEGTDRAVRFGTVEVHYHMQEIGSTVPMRGPPLGLSWTRISYEKFESIDNFLSETHPTGRPRPYKMLQQPSTQRADILLALGYTLREIQASTREAGLVRTKRKQSARYSSRNQNWLHLLRNARKSGRDPLQASTKKNKESIKPLIVPAEIHA